MARKMDPKNLVEFKELLMANEIFMEALVQLLVEKGILTEEELLQRIKQVQIQMTQKRSV